ncbi:MAG: SRPBCC family protein [Myxococcota bacterium]
MSIRYLELIQTVPLDPADAFEALTDPELMGRHLGADIEIIAGPSRTNVGTVRRIRAGGLSIDEEITSCDRPNRVVYRIIRGLPVKYHMAEMLFEEVSEGTHITWSVGMEARKPLSTRVLLMVLKRNLGTGLRRLGRA